MSIVGFLPYNQTTAYMNTTLTKILSPVLFVAGIIGLLLMFSETETATETQWLTTFLYGGLLATASFSLLYLLEKRGTTR